MLISYQFFLYLPSSVSWGEIVTRQSIKASALNPVTIDAARESPLNLRLNIILQTNRFDQAQLLLQPPSVVFFGVFQQLQ